MNLKAGIRTRKIRRVEEHLKNLLLPLPDGGKLPGIRSIRKQTGCGQSCVIRALERLEKEGLLRVDPYRGIFRVIPSEKKEEIRLLHWTEDDFSDISFMGNLFRELRKQAAAAGREITLEKVCQRSQEEIAGDLGSHNISRCIICGSKSVEFTSYLSERMKVCLELLPRHSDQVVTELRDSPEMTVMQIDYLLKLGYRRIGYLHYGGNDITVYPIQIMRLLDYYRLMAENGLRVDPDWVYHCDDACENLDAGMERMMNSDPRPEVLIVPGTKTLARVYAWCRKHRIRIGKDLAVFRCDETSRKNYPEVTTITNNPQEIARTFWRMFQAAERGEKVESAYTELFIRTGQTVPNLKSKS